MEGVVTPCTVQKQGPISSEQTFELNFLTAFQHNISRTILAQAKYELHPY